MEFPSSVLGWHVRQLTLTFSLFYWRIIWFHVAYLFQLGLIHPACLCAKICAPAESKRQTALTLIGLILE